jgi:dihydroorotase
MSILFFKNARLMDPATGRDEKGCLLVEGGTIMAYGPDLKAPKGAEVIDAKGKILAPGIIDMRSFSADTLAAAKGGITSILLNPKRGRLDTPADIAHEMAKYNGEGKVRVYCAGTATKGTNGNELSEIGLMQLEGAKMFTDASKAVNNARVMQRLLEYADHFNALVCQFPEEPDLAKGGNITDGDLATRIGLAGIPIEAEVMMIERDLRLLDMVNTRLHIAPVTSALAVDAIRDAKKAGKKVSAATAPAWFALNEVAIGDYVTFAKVSPPLRDEANREAIVKGLADGTIDIICSDHRPLSGDHKNLPFSQAEAGILGYETLLPLAVELSHNGDVDLMTVLRAMTSAPADLLGLPQGRIGVGAPADLMLMDPDKPWKVEKEKLSSYANNTPFDKRPVQGKVLMTVVDGTIIYKS